MRCEVALTVTVVITVLRMVRFSVWWACTDVLWGVPADGFPLTSIHTASHSRLLLFAKANVSLNQYDDQATEWTT